MIFIVINVIFVLSAVAMIVLILLQRGAGAAAGSGFGGGASATVFGARGSANFLSKATKWLAVLFFSISLGLAIYSSKPHDNKTAADDLGVMGAAPARSSLPHNVGAIALPPAATPGVPTPAIPLPTVPTPVPGAPAGSAPVNAVPTGAAPAIPLPQSALPEPALPQPAVPASGADNGAKPGNKGG